jgi:hypothetical protein
MVSQQEFGVDWTGGRSWLAVGAMTLAFLAAVGCDTFLPGPKAAQVVVKFDIVGGDNAFAATVYAQDVRTGRTALFPYGPHTPYITVDLNTPGQYVFYARLVEAPDDYHYGFTGYQPVAYGHMTRGGTQDPATASLIALDVKPGETYRAYINDYRATLPVSGQPVSVPWRPE